MVYSQESDDYPGFNLSQFTADDFAKIDADVAKKYESTSATKLLHTSDTSEPTAGGDILAGEDDAHSDTDTIPIEDEDDPAHRPSDASFRSDDFDINLGQLTAEQLALLDGPAPAALPTTTTASPFTADRPALEIELEDDVVVAPLLAETYIEPAAVIPPPPPPPATTYTTTNKRWHDKSPLERFRSYVSLSVTDLVAPSWCEVQYDYGLRGKRSRPLKDRPKSFVSASGKTIVPTVAVAQKNDNTTRQGLKVHKELEREIKFEELKVDITTPETRWALRLVNMIACLRGILDGFTREMPVFGILHDEIVVGIMDEVVKLDYTRDSGLSPDGKRTSDSPQKTKPGAKKPRLEKSPSRQKAIDSYFDSPTRKKASAGGDTTNATTGTTNSGPTSRPSWQVTVDRFFDNSTKANANTNGKGKGKEPAAGPSRPKWQVGVNRFFEQANSSATSRPQSPGPPPEFALPPGPTTLGGCTLQIKDNKTRRIKSMPSDADSYSGRMQLMIYRRLLSQLVSINPPYDFRPLWKKLHLDSTQIFPTKFLVQAQLIQESASVEFPVTCLDDLVESWYRVVRESGVRGVSSELELVYRLRPSEDKNGKGKGKAREGVVEGGVVDLEAQEALDLAKAIEESLETSGNTTVAVQHPTGADNLKVLSEKEQLQWALQQSMLPQVGGQAESSDTPRPSTPPVLPAEKPQKETEAEGKPKGKGKVPESIREETGIRRYEIIGTHKFTHDDAQLDRHLDRVLDWWHGWRKPEGVSLETSYRCSTCEYINDCEWRAEKALQHLVKKRSERSLRREGK